MFPQRDAVWLVALNTLLHEIGVPVPITPIVLVAGAGSVGGGIDPLAVIAAVVAATLAGNSIWFAAGRRWGSGVLTLLCRLSLSPDACMLRTEDSFRRWGWSSLVLGRFIPGVALVAPPLAGALGMSWGRFIVLSAAGAGLWALVVVAAGMLFHEQVDVVVRTLDAFAAEAVVAAALLLAAALAWRWQAKRRAGRNRNAARIAGQEC
jgi:membrane protein DedA with SNARE-associated domain